MLVFGLRQMKGYEPGDADWGVKLSDVRGQEEQKSEVTRVITLWQSGDEFRKAGGKPERGLLFIGAPGTGKTMLSKAIGHELQLADRDDAGLGLRPDVHRHGRDHRPVPDRKARKLAKKWGGQCIIFIDEIDAVGLRRAALGGGGTAGGMTPAFEDLSFHGSWGARTSAATSSSRTAPGASASSPPAPRRRAASACRRPWPPPTASSTPSSPAG